MTAAFKAEMQREGREIYPLADLGYPDSPFYNYFSSSPCLNYNPIVIEGGWGDVRQGIAIRPPGSLERLSTTLKLDDTDRSVTRILKGRYDPRRTRLLMRWGSPRLATADWFTFFDGILSDWTYEGTSVTLNAGTDDRALHGFIPKQPILAGAFRGAPAASLGTYLPIVYGIHDSSSLSGTGMIPTVCISYDATLGYRYSPTIGKGKSVPRVWVGSSAQTIVADPPANGQVSITYPIYGGLQVTSINFGTAPAATDVIRCDIEGLTVDGTSTGAVILNPCDQLKHLLVNFVFGDWRSGAWLADSTAPVDASAFAVAGTFAAQFGYEGSRIYGGSSTQVIAGQVIQDFLQSHPMLRLYWTRAGKLGCVALDHRSPGYIAAPWIKEEQDASLGSSLVQVVDASQLVQRVNMSYLFGEADSKYWASLSVQDLRVAEKTAESMQWPWSSSRFV